MRMKIRLVDWSTSNKLHIILFILVVTATLAAIAADTAGSAAQAAVNTQPDLAKANEGTESSELNDEDDGPPDVTDITQMSKEERDAFESRKKANATPPTPTADSTTTTAPTTTTTTSTSSDAVTFPSTTFNQEQQHESKAEQLAQPEQVNVTVEVVDTSRHDSNRIHVDSPVVAAARNAENEQPPPITTTIATTPETVLKQEERPSETLPTTTAATTTPNLAHTPPVTTTVASQPNNQHQIHSSPSTPTPHGDTLPPVETTSTKSSDTAAENDEPHFETSSKPTSSTSTLAPPVTTAPSTIAPGSSSEEPPAVSERTETRRDTKPPTHKTDSRVKSPALSEPTPSTEPPQQVTEATAEANLAPAITTATPADSDIENQKARPSEKINEAEINDSAVEHNTSTEQVKSAPPPPPPPETTTIASSTAPVTTIKTADEPVLTTSTTTTNDQVVAPSAEEATPVTEIKSESTTTAPITTTAQSVEKTGETVADETAVETSDAENNETLTIVSNTTITSEVDEAKVVDETKVANETKNVDETKVANEAKVADEKKVTHEEASGKEQQQLVVNENSEDESLKRTAQEINATENAISKDATDSPTPVVSSTPIPQLTPTISQHLKKFRQQASKRFSQPVDLPKQPENSESAETHQQTSTNHLAEHGHQSSNNESGEISETIASPLGQDQISDDGATGEEKVAVFPKTETGTAKPLPQLQSEKPVDHSADHSTTPSVHLHNQEQQQVVSGHDEHDHDHADDVGFELQAPSSFTVDTVATVTFGPMLPHTAEVSSVQSDKRHDEFQSLSSHDHHHGHMLDDEHGHSHHHHHHEDESHRGHSHGQETEAAFEAQTSDDQNTEIVANIDETTGIDQQNVSKRELEITTTPTAAKVCMNLTPLKQLFVTYLAVVYKPLVTTLLPDSMQLLLLDEATFSFLGFNLISALVVGQFVLLALGLCIQVSKRASDGRAKRIYHLNQQLVALLSRVQVLEYEKGTLAALVAETEKSNKNSSGPGNNSRPASTSSRKKSDSINQQQSQQQQHNQQQQDNGHVFRLERELMQVRQAHEHAMTEVARNRASLDAMAAELRSVTSQYGQLDEEKRDMEYQVATLTEAVKEWEQRCAHGEQKLGYYENLFREQQAHAEKLNAELEQRENTVTMLKNSLLLRVNNQKQSQVTAAAANTSTDTDSDDLEVINRDELTAGDGHGQLEASPPVTMDTVMHVAQLEMSVKTLRDKYAASEADRAQKTSECLSLVQQLSERSEAVYGLEAKVKRLERQQKEGEIQIRLLGELREKDAKQHLRSLADIDTQLKKKTTESEKVSHLLEQLRAKQERIHEMETLVSRTERQANQERQTFEKQAHESWLASKKIDKQLRDAQAELVVLQNRINEHENINRSLSSEIAQLKQLSGNHQQQQQQQQQQGSLSTSNSRHQLNHPSQVHFKKEENNSDESRSSSAYIVRDSDITDGAKEQIAEQQQQQQQQQRPLRPSSVASNPGHFVNPLNPMAAAAAAAAAAGMPFMRPPMMPFRFPFQPPAMNPMAAAAFMQHLEQQQQQQQQQRAGSPASTHSDMAQTQAMMYRMPPPAAFMVPQFMQQQFQQQQQQQQQQHDFKQEASDNNLLSNSASSSNLAGGHSEPPQLYNNNRDVSYGNTNDSSHDYAQPNGGQSSDAYNTRFASSNNNEETAVGANNFYYSNGNKNNNNNNNDPMTSEQYEANLETASNYSNSNKFNI